MVRKTTRGQLNVDILHMRVWKGKSAVRIHREVLHIKKITGLHFWSRGYCVSTVGLDEKTIRKYIREQEKREKEQLELDFDK